MRFRLALPVLLTVVVLAGAAARFYNLSWDENTHQHPDERHITIVATALRWPESVAGYFDTERSPLNPYNLQDASFVYGTLPVFVAKAVAGLLGMDDYDGYTLAGRSLSALASSATILLAFLLGRRLYGRLAGIAAAVLLGGAPLAIQHAHFFVMDPFLSFFSLLVIFFAVRYWQEGRRQDIMLAGLAFGLAVACKLTGLALLPTLLLAVALRWPRKARPAGSPAERSQLASTLAITLLIAFVTFRVAQPYAFAAPSLNPASWVTPNQRFVDDQRQQSQLLGGKVSYPPSVQWIGRTSHVYPLQQMITWGMGPALGLAGWLSLAYAAFRLLRYRELKHLLPLSFVLFYFGYMGQQFSLYLRYFLPLYPLVAVFAGYGLVQLLEGATRLGQRLRRPAVLVASRWCLAGVLVLGVLAGLAYTSIYSRPLTRIEATKWARDNLPPGSTIASEHWDDRVPGYSEDRFRFLDLPLYETETPEKVAKLISTLDSADYISISSNRLLTSIPRNPLSYPVTSRYYSLLFDGSLGFRLLRSFESYPSLLGIRFPDHSNEESWSSYDHPRVLIFEKTASYSPARTLALLSPGSQPAISIAPAQADRNALLLSAPDLAKQRDGGTFSKVFAGQGLAKSQPTLLWLLALELAALAVTPAAFLLLRRLPDRGYLLTKPLGLLLLAYPVWLLVSLKMVDFAREIVALTLLAMLLAGMAFAYRRRAELLAYVRANWRLLLICESVFLLAFLFFWLLRMENPDLWHPARGGEKPMDLAYLTAIIRSTTLPPYDPWFSGGYINYYYLGHFFTATIARLTMVPPEVAFNLALPTYFALTAAAVFSLGYNLSATARLLTWGKRRLMAPPSWSPYAGGGLAVVLVCLAGNLDGVGQLVERLSEVSAWSVDLPVLGGAINAIGGLWQVVAKGAELRDFDYWRPSRMMPPTISITEFPYFSFLFADLHAHLMAIPFQALSLGLCLSLVLRPRASNSGPQWPLVLLLGLVVGSLRWINSWDYPPFLALALLALLISERHRSGGWLETSIRLSLLSALLVGASLLFYLPFLANYQSPVSGIQSAPETTPIHQYAAHFGLLLVPVGVWLLLMAYRGLRQPLRARLALLGRASTLQLSLVGAIFGTLTGILLVKAPDRQTLVLLLLLPLALTGGLMLREWLKPRRDSGLRLFLLSLVLVALGLSAAVDLVTIKGDIVRMNTVFKFYLHVWLLLAVTASFAVWYLFFGLRIVRDPSNIAARLSLSAARALVLLLIAGGLLYPIFATPVRLDDRFAALPPGLDGLAYMRTAVYNDPKGPIELKYDLAGIEWLRKNVDGTPAIVEGRAELYRWGARFSINTGLPAVLGWDWHQTQQRGSLAFMVSERAQAVDNFYSKPDRTPALQFLQRYDVSYVIVGQLERLYYPAEGLRKFADGLGGALEVAYSNPQLVIYRVRAGLADASLALSP